MRVSEKPRGVVFEERIKKLFHLLGFEVIASSDYLGHSYRLRKFQPDFFINIHQPPLVINAIVEVKYYKSKINENIISQINNALNEYKNVDKAIIVSYNGFSESAIKIISNRNLENKIILTSEIELMKSLPKSYHEEYLEDYSNFILEDTSVRNSFIEYKFRYDETSLLETIPKKIIWNISKEKIGEKELISEFTKHLGKNFINNLLSKSSIYDIEKYMNLIWKEDEKLKKKEGSKEKI